MQDGERGGVPLQRVGSASLPLSRLLARGCLIERRGEAEAVVISTAEYNRLMDAAEEVEDAAAFDSAMAEEGPNIPWDQVKADLGW